MTFAMGSDGVLPRQFGKTDPKFKTPVLATVIIGVIAAIGVWLYTFGSSSVQDSFTTVVSVDGLLFALYYALTGIATAVYYRKLAVRSPWSIVQLAVFPLAAAGFLAYIIVRSVEGLGGWTGSDLDSLYVKRHVRAAAGRWPTIRWLVLAAAATSVVAVAASLRLLGFPGATATPASPAAGAQDPVTAISTSSAVAEMPVAPEATLTGVKLLSVVPLPIWPSLPPPQA